MIWGAIPGQVAAITMAFNITDEEVLRLWLANLMSRLIYAYIDVKGELRTIET